MEEPEVLMQRFIDNELAPRERLHFLKELDQDQALRRRLLNIETLIAEASRLPRLAPSTRFASEVLARLPVTSSSFLGSLRALLWAPHVLRWNLAGALTVGCVSLVLVWSLGRTLLEPPTATSVTEGPRTEATVLVRLVLLQPQAGSVAVAGDFNGWNPVRTPLHQTDGGVWTATIPLKPGRYHYMFVVDGQRWLTDPLAAEVSLDGFGAQNAVLEIDPPL